MRDLIVTASGRCDFQVVEGFVGKLEQDKRDDSWPTNPENRIPSLSAKLTPTPYSTGPYVWRIVRELAVCASEMDLMIDVRVVDGIVIVAVRNDYWGPEKVMARGEGSTPGLKLSAGHRGENEG